MDSKQASLMNNTLNSIAKSLQSINRNLVSLVEFQDTGYTLISEEGMGHKRPIYTRDADLYRLEHPERCPEVDSDGPPEEMIVSDCGKILTHTQQVRSDDPPTQQTIDDIVEALKHLKWQFHSKQKQTQHLDHLIKQLEEMRGWLQDWY